MPGYVYYFDSCELPMVLENSWTKLPGKKGWALL